MGADNHKCTVVVIAGKGTKITKHIFGNPAHLEKHRLKGMYSRSKIPELKHIEIL